MAWVKGERCGVDNCPSRFWILSDGQYVCQNGHIRAGVEFAADDDEVYTGRKIKRPRLEVRQETTESAILHGAKAHALFVQCLQTVYRAQIGFLIDKLELPVELETSARLIWGYYLNTTKFSGNKPTSDDPSLLSTIACCYLACMRMQIPVYVSDLLRWAWRFQIPYMDALCCISPATCAKLPASLIAALRPSSYPRFGKLHKLIRKIMMVLPAAIRKELPNQPIEPFLFKVVRDLLLPPQIYTGSARILRILGITSRIPTDTRTKIPYWEFPEIGAICTVIISAKLCFGLDGIRRNVQLGTPAADHADWGVWKDMVRKLWLMDEEFTSLEEKDCLYWDKNQLDRYLDWFHDRLARDSKEQDAVRQRMLRLFPLPRQANVTPDFADDETVAELNSLLTETVGDDSSDLSVPQCKMPRPPPTPDAVAAGPGSLFQLYQENGSGIDSAPELVELLFAVASKFTGIDPQQIRVNTSRLERRLRDCNNEVFKTMEREGSVVSVPGHRLARGRPRQSRAGDTASPAGSKSPLSEGSVPASPLE